MGVSGMYVISGVILRRRNVGEADRVVTVFTKEYGKIRIIAKGVRRIYSRRSPHVEPFRHVRLTLRRGRTLDSVTEAVSLESGGIDTTVLPRVGYAYFVCELVDRLLPERLEHRDIYVLLVDTLGKIREATTWRQLKLSGHEFALTMLRNLGYIPRDSELPEEDVVRFIERIIERRLNSPVFLTRLEP